MDLQALEYIPIPIVVLDRAGPERFEYAWMNRACAAFSGLSIAAIRGRTAAEVFPGRAGEQLAQRQVAAAQSAQPAHYEYPLWMGEREVWVQTDLVPVCTPEGDTIRLIATMQDRTEAHSMAVQNIEADTTLKGLESEIEQYVSMAAHDLRTPMRHVSEIAAMLREDFVDQGDGKLDLIDLLEEVGDKASELILEVLSYARSSSVAQTRRAVDLFQLSSDIFAILDPKRQHELSPTVGLVETDPVALQITLRNLVDNSIKHSGADKARVQITFDGEQDGFLAFSVRDHGRGLDDPAVAFLETGEYRYDSGFGLLGIKRMLTSRNGTIAAMTPGDGQGTMVRFTLPGTALGSMPEERDSVEEGTSTPRLTTA